MFKPQIKDDIGYTKEQLDYAYRQCSLMTQNHYENFPTASKIFPKALRQPIAAIYAFAREADDIVDEGSASDEQRLKELHEYRQYLETIKNHNQINHPTFIALTDTIKNYQLPYEPFFALLDAFESDITTKIYTDEQGIDNYCKLSANPIGELMLRLFNQHNTDSINYSNAWCTALQRINFLQDINSDYHQRQRIYIAQSTLDLFDLEMTDILEGNKTDNIIALIDNQLSYIKNLWEQGQDILPQTHGRLKTYLVLTDLLTQRLIKKLYKRQHRTNKVTRIKKRDLILLPLTWARSKVKR